MAEDKPTRLKIPSPDARSARSPFPDGFVLAVSPAVDRFVPVVQWGSMRIRLRITGAAGILGFAWARPARQHAPNPPQTAFVYTVDGPAINGGAWVDGVELSLEITDVEHQGENWLRIRLDAAGDCAVDFCDISGELFGTYH